jgi:hypothetical protein
MVRQGYNNAESVLVSSAMQADTVVPTQPSWSPLLIDSVVGYTATANAVYAQPLWAHSVSTGLSNCNPCNMLVVAAMGGGLYAFNGGTSATGGGTNAGATVWSRNTRSSSGQNTTNYLWYDDCQGGTYSTAGPAAPFNIYPYTAGILSTPKIDRSANAIYVTSACSTNIHTSNTQVWYIHKVSLLNGQDLVTPVQITGSAPGSDGADDVTTNSPCSVSNPCIPFNPNEVLQRPALLELTSPSTLIYVAFGWGTLYEKEDAYHGWVFGYDQNLNQKFAFVTTAKGTTGNTDFPGCTPQCPTCLPYADGGCSPNSTCVVTGYHESANWCGHAGASGCPGAGPRPPPTRTAFRTPISRSATALSSKTPRRPPAPCLAPSRTGATPSWTSPSHRAGRAAPRPSTSSRTGTRRLASRRFRSLWAPAATPTRA